MKQMIRRGTYVQAEIYGELLAGAVGAVLGLMKVVRVCKQLGWLD